MRIALSTLQYYLPCNLTAEEISKYLTLAGLEVEKIENERPSFTGVVAGKILEVANHPNADKLHLLKVTDGKEIFSIVCGASNVKQDNHVALAKVGATLTDKDGKKWTIKQAKIRGSESFGMCCSEEELQLQETSDGIIELDPSIPLGTDLGPILVDPVFEIALTPNLNRCNCYIGIARELAAAISKKIQFPPTRFIENDLFSLEKEIQIKVEDPSACPRYSLRMIKNIRSQPTPEWVKKCLKTAHIQSKNLIVDILNFVMLETNQPLHAFDAKKIMGKKIFIKTLKNEALFFGLDQKERTLPQDAITIEDQNKIIAAAGIMGCENSCINDQTTDIFIESAYFNPSLIRRASKKLNLSTDASFRFEKEIDPNGTLFALDRVCNLLSSITSCDIVKGSIDVKKDSFSSLHLHLRIDRTNALLGTHLSYSEMESILNRLEMETKQHNPQQMIVSVPTYRRDIKEEIDLVEEIARIYGYNNIERKAPYFHISTKTDALAHVFENICQNILVEEGMQEIITSDLIGPNLLNKFPSLALMGIISVLHYKSIEQSLLRPSLMPSFLEVVKRNMDYKNKNLFLFETAHAYSKDEKGYLEEPMIAFLMTGLREKPHFSNKAENCDFFDMKGSVENFLNRLFIDHYSLEKSSSDLFHPARQAQIKSQKKVLGMMGEIHPAILKSMDIKQKVYFCEMSLKALQESIKTKISVEPLPEFPSSERDITLTVSSKIEAGFIIEAFKSFKIPYLEKIEMISLYENPQNKSHLNLTFRLTYLDKTKTLVQEEVEKSQALLVKKIEEKLLHLEG
jgi:phenylalanyl-tRNA synthetase beta chain